MYIYTYITVGTGCFPGVKRPGGGVVALTTHPPSSAEVKEEVELCLYSPSGTSWPVLGWTVSLPLQINICDAWRLIYINWASLCSVHLSYSSPFTNANIEIMTLLGGKKTVFRKVNQIPFYLRHRNFIITDICKWIIQMLIKMLLTLFINTVKSYKTARFITSTHVILYVWSMRPCDRLPKGTAVEVPPSVLVEMYLLALSVPAVGMCRYIACFTLILLTWRMWWASNDASRWQMGFITWRLEG